MTTTALLHDDAAYNQLLGKWLTRADVRITRGLKHLAWSTTDALFLVLEVPDSQIGEYAKVLTRLVESGHIERRVNPTQFRLIKEIDVPSRVAPRKPMPSSSGMEGEERDGWFYWRHSWRKT